MNDTVQSKGGGGGSPEGEESGGVATHSWPRRHIAGVIETCRQGCVIVINGMNQHERGELMSTG